MNSKDELLPCPFCGNKTKEVFFTEDYYAFILCRKCGAHGPSLLTQEITGSTKEAICKSWNTRHTPQPSADSGMKSAEEWYRDVPREWLKGEDVIRETSLCEYFKQIQQDAFAAGVRSTKEKGE